MKAAIYARYSSENQRPESIEDQVSTCRKLAAQRNLVIVENHIYTDMAASGARKDRPGLAALLSASEERSFEVVLVDDLSRLARDNFLMLSILAELRFQGVRVVSVADGLDSEDEEATVGIQVRGIFNELQLRDLRKKTLRGQIGQKERGFCVGERTYGYKSIPVGTLRMEKKETSSAGWLSNAARASRSGHCAAHLSRVCSRGFSILHHAQTQCGGSPRAISFQQRLVSCNGVSDSS